MSYSKKDAEKIGVQVKRHRNSISVEQIRSLAGAMVVNDVTKGVFVTTSRFERGSARTVDLLRVRGYPIELIDAPRFFDMLNLTQIDAPESLEQIDIQRCLSSMKTIEHQRTLLLF